MPQEFVDSPIAASFLPFEARSYHTVDLVTVFRLGEDHLYILESLETPNVDGIVLLDSHIVELHDDWLGLLERLCVEFQGPFHALPVIAQVKLESVEV